MWVSGDKMFKVGDTARFRIETVQKNWTWVSGSHPKLSTRTSVTSQSVLCFTKLPLVMERLECGHISLKLPFLPKIQIQVTPLIQAFQ